MGLIGNSFFFAHRTKIMVLVLLPMVAAFTAWMLSKKITPVYRATTTLMITNTYSSTGREALDFNTIMASRFFPKTYAEIARSQKSMDYLSAGLNHTISPERLRSMIKVVPVNNLEFMQINVEDIDPERAAFIANYLVKVLEQQGKYIWETGNLRIVQSAYPPPAPFKPRVLANVIAAGSSGFILAALWFIYIDRAVLKTNRSS